MCVSINGLHLIQVVWLGQCGWGIDCLGDPTLLISYGEAMTKLSKVENILKAAQTDRVLFFSDRKEMRYIMKL